jgi:hypothetical protein
MHFAIIVFGGTGHMNYRSIFSMTNQTIQVMPNRVASADHLSVTTAFEMCK